MKTWWDAGQAVHERVADGWRQAVLSRARDGTHLLTGRRLMVVSPHPDDETFGCGATVARARAAGDPVTVVVATDGRHSTRSKLIDPPRLAELRSAELRSACRTLNVGESELVQLRYEDGSLDRYEADLGTRLFELIVERRPDLVLVSAAQDEHPDHRAAHRAVLRAMVNQPVRPAVLAYPIWSWAHGPWAPGRGRLPRPSWQALRNAARRWVLVPAEEHLATKRAAMASYTSQTSNLTGETTWRHLSADFCALFLQPAEVFLPVLEAGVRGDRLAAKMAGR